MLIAKLCKKDFDNNYPDYGCTSPKVQNRLEWGPIGTLYNNEIAVEDEINAICQACTEWDPIYQKPNQDIANACKLARTFQCPQERGWRTFSKGSLSSLDELCRSCRFFTPS